MPRNFQSYTTGLHDLSAPLALSNSQSLHLEPAQLIENEAPFIGAARDKAEIATGKLSALTVTIYVVGITEGLTHLAALAIYYLLKDDLKLTPAQTSAILIIPTIPWFLKPVFAFFTDAVTVFGSRRRFYLFTFALAQSLGYWGLAAWHQSLTMVSVMLSLIATGSTICSTMCEALVVEQNAALNADELHAASASVTKLLGAKAVGSLLVSYFSGSMLEHWSKTTIFRATGFFPLVICFCTLFISEVAETQSFANRIELLKGNLRRVQQFVSRRVIWGPALFILIFMCGPDYDDALFYFYTDRLHFSASFMGTLRLTYGIAAVIGLLLYQWCFTNASYRRVLFATVLLNLPIYASPFLLVTGWNRKAHISDELFTLSGGFLIEAIAEIQLLPLLVFASLICPPGLEGTIYSFLMCIRYFGGTLGKLSSSVCIYLFGITSTNYANLPKYILFCSSLTLVPLLFFRFVPSNEEMIAEKQKIFAKSLPRAAAC